MKLRIISFVVFVLPALALLMAGCATQTMIQASPVPLEARDWEARNAMIGVWHGRQPTREGGIHEWLVIRRSDGTYQIDFRMFRPSGCYEQLTEFGDWGLSGSVYFTIYGGSIEGGKTNPADKEDPANYDAYHVLHLTDEEFVYRHARHGNMYTVRKVDPGYSMQAPNGPECQKT